MPKVTVILVCLILLSNAIYPQDKPLKLKNKRDITFSAGMGVDYGTSPDFTDYLRDEIPYSNKDSIKSFQAGVEFYGGLEYELSSNISAKLDYSYFIRSASYTYNYFVFDYSIISHQPYLFFNYLIKEPGYKIKIGAGAGYHFQFLENHVNKNLTYKSSGFGIRGEGVYSPRLSKKIWGYFGIFVFGNFYGKLKDDNDNVLKASNSNIEANLKGYGVGLRLGISYLLN